MTKYTHADFMPHDPERENPVESSVAEEVAPVPNDNEPLQTVREDCEQLAEDEPADKERNPAPVTRNPEGETLENPPYVPDWAKWVSIFFSPLLIPTYCVALPMWTTKLSLLKEDTRLAVSFIVLIFTALLPLTFILTISKLQHYKNKEVKLMCNTRMAAFLFFACQLVTAYYLYRIHAPEWLVMFVVAGAAVTVMMFIINLFFSPSYYTAGMGVLTAVMMYMAHNSLLDVSPTPWIGAIIILSGLVMSARLAAGAQKTLKLVWYYILGCAVAYAVMNIHFFNSSGNV